MVSRGSAALFNFGSDTILILGGMEAQVAKDIVVVKDCFSKQPDFLDCSKGDRGYRIVGQGPTVQEPGCIVQQSDKIIVLQNEDYIRDLFELQLPV